MHLTNSRSLIVVGHVKYPLIASTRVVDTVVVFPLFDKSCKQGPQKWRRGTHIADDESSICSDVLNGHWLKPDGTPDGCANRPFASR